MSTGIPPCRSFPFVAALLSLANGVNERAAEQAQIYLDSRLDPVKEEMKNQVSGIALVVVIILVFFVIIPMLVYIIWIAYELSATAGMLAAMFLVFLVLSLMLVYTVISVVSNTINTVINTATREVIALNNPQSVNALKVSFNGAAAQYVLKTTGSATCLMA